jgi:hypothetical protein
MSNAAHPLLGLMVSRAGADGPAGTATLKNEQEMASIEGSCFAFFF